MTAPLPPNVRPGYRWVRRTEDKPHRCPECHAVATWDRKHAGPRTRLRCPRSCGVQWRYGARIERRGRWMKEFFRTYGGSDA